MVPLAVAGVEPHASNYRKTGDEPVTIWQGSEDDWTPPAMAEALAALLPTTPAVHILPGCSHFSTLRAYLEAEPRP